MYNIYNIYNILYIIYIIGNICIYISIPAAGWIHYACAPGASARHRYDELTPRPCRKLKQINSGISNTLMVESWKFVALAGALSRTVLRLGLLLHLSIEFILSDFYLQLQHPAVALQVNQHLQYLKTTNYFEQQQSMQTAWRVLERVPVRASLLGKKQTGCAACAPDPSWCYISVQVSLLLIYRG